MSPILKMTMQRPISFVRSSTILDVALVSILLFIFCSRIWNIGLTHIDDALWALWAHSPDKDPSGEWAMHQGRLYAFPYGALMLHAYARLGTIYGEILRVGSFSLFFVLFHVFVALYSGRRLALFSSSAFFAFFALRWEASCLTSGPLAPWLFGSAALVSALFARAYARTGRPALAISAALCLFVSLFTNEALSLYYGGLLVLVVCWNALDNMTVRPTLRACMSELIRPGRTRTLLMAFLAAFLCFASLSIGWRIRYPSQYDGHVLAPFSLMQIAETTLQFSTSNSILRDFVQPYRMNFGDAVAGAAGLAVYRPLGFARTLVSYPAAVMFGVIVAYHFCRAAAEQVAAGPKRLRVIGPEIFALLVGLSLAFLPMLPPAATAKYQGWYFNLGVTSFSTAIFSYFGLSLSLAAVFSLLIRPSYAWWRPALVAVLAPAVGVTAAISYRMNDVIALDMRAESARWRVLGQAIESINAARMDVAAIWAPRFRSGTWFTHALTLPYWADYARARHQANVRFLDALPPSEKLKSVAYLDYFLADDERSFITTVARLRPTDADEPRVLADIVAVHLERPTATMLRTSRLSFLDHSGTLQQIPLERLTGHGPRGEIRVLEHARVVPASIRIVRQTFLKHDIRPCATSETIRQTVYFGTSHGEKDWDCIGKAALQSGWGAMESGGVWSLGKNARLSIATDGMPREHFALTFDLSTFTGRGFHRGTQTVRVFVKDRQLATWAFTTGAPPPEMRLVISPDLLDPAGTLDVAFEIDPPINSKALGVGNDDRELGISLRSLRMDWSTK